MTDYRLCRAKVESNRLPDINRYLCRIIPDMEEITETVLLPEYPFFLKMEQDALSKGDIIWCLVTDDFQVGYILGLCENAIGRSIISIIEEINAVENEFNLPLSKEEELSFNIQDYVFLEFSNKKTRITGKINYAGSLVLYTADGSIFLKAINSKIKMKSDGETEFESKNETHNIDGTLTVNSAKFIETSAIKEEDIISNKLEKVGGNKSTIVVGGNESIYTKDSTETFLAKKKEIVGQGEEVTIALGGSKTTVVAGDYTVFVGAGGLNLTSIKGMNLTAGPTGIKVLSGGPIELTATQIKLTTPLLEFVSALIKTGTGVAGGSPGPFCSLPLCLFTGAPHTGNTFTGA